jgi:hypothetical protein
MAAGWQTAFTNDVNELTKTKNTETLSELLLKFFDFYFHFDFLQYVVAPYHGKVLPIKDFKMEITDPRIVDFEITALNIQDVFILSRNVCKIEKLTVFKLALLSASKMLQCKEKKFNLLFDSNEYQRILDIHYFKYMSERPKVCFVNLDYDCMTKFENLQSWYDAACKAVYEVLQFGLLVECEVIDKIYTRKNKDKSIPHSVNNDIAKDGTSKKSELLKNNLNDTIPSPYDLQLLLSIQCVLYSRTWIGRKNAEVSKPDAQDELEVFADSALNVEYCISKSLVNNNPLLSSPIPVLCFKCDCYKHVSPEISDMVVMLKPLTVSREFYQVSAFLASFIPRTVKKILSSN